MEKYLAAAEKVARSAIVIPPKIKPTVQQYLSPRIPRTEGDIQQDGDIPFSTEGVLQTQHHFPLDAEYLVQLSVVDHRERVEPKEGGDPEAPNVAQMILEVDAEQIRVFEIVAGEYPFSEFQARIELKAGQHTLKGVSSPATRTPPSLTSPVWL